MPKGVVFSFLFFAFLLFHHWLLCCACCNADAHLQDYLHDHHQEQYARASYTSLEISPKLAEVQQQKVLHDGKHRSCYKVAQHDASAPLAWGAVNEQPCVIILMEVLDNLPHDRCEFVCPTSSTVDVTGKDWTSMIC
jgi:hypothetical protein